VPTYQYRCTDCGEDLEVVQKFSDEPLTVCPACQGSLRKVFSPVGIVFKGSGFYRTDSRNGSGEGKKKEPAAKQAESSGAADSGKAAANGSADSGSGSSAAKASGDKPSGAKESASSAPASAPAATGS
jgi:putative FmdB family regulatory protein